MTMNKMDIKNDLWQKVCKAHEKLNEEKNPEMMLYLNLFLVRDQINQDYMDLANNLMNADAGKKIPKMVGNLIIAIYEFEIEANEDELAMNNLGSLYYNGRLGKKDFEMAIKYYSMADKAGCSLATENIAYNYFYGLGTDVDYAMAHKYFTKAALMGRYGAMYKLGDMYRYGYYVDVDPKMAFRCYNQALELGSHDHVEMNVCLGSILYRIADAYYEGIGVEISLVAAMNYYQKAELALYEQIRGGDQYHTDKIQYVIDKQQEIREKLNKELPITEF